MPPAALILSLVLTFVSAILIGRWIAHRQADVARERAIFAYFAAAAKTQNEKPLSLGVELNWVALQRCGYPGDTYFRKLEPAVKARVQVETEELRRVAHGLIGRGLLRLFLADMRIGDKMTKLPSPPTLVCLTSSGEALVNQMIGEAK